MHRDLSKKVRTHPSVYSWNTHTAWAHLFQLDRDAFFKSLHVTDLIKKPSFHSCIPCHLNQLACRAANWFQIPAWCSMLWKLLIWKFALQPLPVQARKETMMAQSDLLDRLSLKWMFSFQHRSFHHTTNYDYVFLSYADTCILMEPRQLAWTV